MHYELPKYFLGANSPSGFVSRFDHLYDPNDGWFCYILKGGPGTGKSTLMKKAAKEAGSAQIDVELIYCSSDPNSLDAVIFPEIKVCIVDGTAPHTMDPRYPGVADTIVNMGDCWDTALLAQRKEQIIATTLHNSGMHQRSKRYLSACGSLHEDTIRVSRSSVNEQKAVNFAANLGKKFFGSKHTCKGKEKVRLLSGITPEGFIYFEDTISSQCSNVYFIEDEYDAVGSLLLTELKDHALQAGLDVVGSYCPMSPLNKMDALLIPSIDLAFAVSNSWHPLTSIEPYRTIHARRFIDHSILSTRRQRLSFNRKTQRILLNESIAYLAMAKAIHDELEALYADCMDYSKADQIYEKIIAEILSR
ncbi:MAG: hypothetical protein HFE39_05900 [Clostridiales bacterium]|jgi:Cdc6-like AAA superfamily ATPase|nr:hypothetical protein [Clostridiales bacterium]